MLASLTVHSKYYSNTRAYRYAMYGMIIKSDYDYCGGFDRNPWTSSSFWLQYSEYK